MYNVSGCTYIHCYILSMFKRLKITFKSYYLFACEFNYETKIFSYSKSGVRLLRIRGRRSSKSRTSRTRTHSYNFYFYIEKLECERSQGSGELNGMKYMGVRLAKWFIYLHCIQNEFAV